MVRQVPLDVPTEPEAEDQGMGRWIGATRKEVGEGHPGLDFALVEFNLRDVLDPATGLPYFGAASEYPTGGMDITKLVCNQRNVNFKRILDVKVHQHSGSVSFSPEVRFPNGQFYIHRPVVGDVMLQLFVQSGVNQEPLAELADQTQVPDIDIRCMVVGNRGLNRITIIPLA